MLRIAEAIQTEDDAYRIPERWRWHRQPVCPHCSSINDYSFIKPRNGFRKTNSGSPTLRRLWRCKDSRKPYSVLTGSVVHETHVPIRTRMFVIYDPCCNKNGVAALEIERCYDLTPKPAWSMRHCIPEAKAHGPGAEPFTGVIVSDETWSMASR